MDESCTDVLVLVCEVLLLWRRQVLFANWAPPCRVLIDNVSEWYALVFVIYRCDRFVGIWCWIHVERVDRPEFATFCCFCLDLVAFLAFNWLRQ